MSNQVDRILDLIDAGLGHGPAVPGAPIKRAFCARDRCGTPPEEGHDFCPPCLAWLRGETDDDPTTLPTESAPNLEELDVAFAWFGGY